MWKACFGIMGQACIASWGKASFGIMGKHVLASWGKACFFGIMWESMLCHPVEKHVLASCRKGVSCNDMDRFLFYSDDSMKQYWAMIMRSGQDDDIVEIIWASCPNDDMIELFGHRVRWRHNWTNFGTVFGRVVKPQIRIAAPAPN